MNEENQDLIEQNKPEWQAPPLPEEIEDIKEPAQMSEVGTLGSIFFEPGKTFEDLRRKPRFIMAALISIIVISLFQLRSFKKWVLKELSKSVLNRIREFSRCPKSKNKH